MLRNLEDVFGQIDPLRRRAAINEIFHEDVAFHLSVTRYQTRGAAQLFLAIPVGSTSTIGQPLNTSGPIQTYERVPGEFVA